MNSSSAPETNSWHAPARDSGLEAVGAIPWGTHFCQFYTSKEDLVETLVPYMKAGLDANELCMWVTSEKLNAREVEAVLRQAVPDLDRYLQEKRIEIADCSQWYEAGGSFDADKIVAGWMGKSGKPSQVLAVAIDISEAKRAEEALRESEERLQTMVGTAIDGIVVIDSGGIIQSLNPAAERMFGYTSGEAIGQSIAILRPEPFRLRRRARSIASAKTLAPKFDRVEVEGLRRDGSIFPAELSVASWEAGEKRFYTGILRDITQRKRREEKIEILLREVNHRSKNLLSLVQAIAAQTAAREPAEFMRHFSERLRALAASQDLLVKSHWRGISIEELVKSQLAHFRDLFGERIELEGLPLRIAASAAQSIGMALHELATNAGKYGALSNGAGQIAIAWSLGDDGNGQRRFRLTWTERGGPPVFLPARRGFGSIVVETMPRMELDAEAELDFAPEGLRWRLDCPVKTVLEANGAVSDLQLLVQ